MAHPPLETDGQGNIVTKPVTGWTTHLIAGSAVLVAVQYVETPEQLETMDSKSIQLVLSPQLCLELAEALTTAANKVLKPSSAQTVVH